MKRTPRTRTARPAIARSIRSAWRLTSSTPSASGARTSGSRKGTGDDPPVDPSGTLPDGRAFADAEQFKQLLLDDRDRFLQAFVEHLCTYGLRRVLTVDDREDIQSIVDEAKQKALSIEGHRPRRGPVRPDAEALAVISNQLAANLSITASQAAND